MKILLIGAAPMVWLLAQTADTTTPPPSLPFENMGQVWLALIFLGGQIVKHVLDTRQRIRDRAWFVEDRKHADQKAEKEAKQIREDLLREAGDIKTEAWKRTDLLSRQLDENTRISTDAFRMTNDVNNKIAQVGGMRMVQDAQKLRRPGDAEPSYDRRADDKPAMTPTRREEDNLEDPV